MRRPDFFIVGAPKCGTTSLYQYLRQHPEIFMPDRKELNFFASDLDLRRYYATASEYTGQFACSKRISGEGTTWYLYSQTASKEIREFNPDSKIIISLRNPTDMVHSLFRFQRYVGLEKLDCLSYVLEREHEYVFSFKGNEPTKHDYIYARAAFYHRQVERYIETFGFANLHLVFFEEIMDNPEKVYRGMLRFLEVSEDFRPAFRNVNKTGRIRIERLQERLKQPPSVIRSVARVLPQHVRRKAYWALRRMNVSYAPPPPLDLDLRRRLNEEFRPDVERLGALIGRDLTHWIAT